MIESAVRIECEEAGGRMTITALLCGTDVGPRFACGDNSVMAIAAITKHFRVINKSYFSKPFWRMTGLTQITCCNVCAWLGPKC